jgi:ABC-type multidrug transport system ATPase subunit
MIHTIPQSRVWQAKNLVAAWGPREAEFRGVSFEISSGEKVALLSDKATTRTLLLRVLTGLQPRREGNLEILGYPVEVLPISADWEQIIPSTLRRRIGVCLENEGLLSNVTVREGLELLFRFKYGDHTEKLREGARKVVVSTAETFGILSVLDQRPNFLNSTERRLAGLARAYLSKPHVLAFESPTKGVSDKTRNDFYRIFESMVQDQSRTFLVATDDWVFARKFCDRWIVLESGDLIFDGKPDHFLKQKSHFTEEIKALATYSKTIDALIKEIA